MAQCGTPGHDEFGTLAYTAIFNVLDVRHFPQT